MGGLSVAERVQLGVLNGRLMGLSLRDYNKIAVVSQLGSQCVATAASLMASFMEETGGVARYFPLSLETLRETVDGVLGEEPQAVVVIVGGEDRLEECQKLLRKLLEVMAEKTFTADLVICLRGYLAGCIVDIARADVSILSYIELTKYLRQWSILTHDVDLDKKVMRLGRLRLEGEKVVFDKIAEYPLTAEHLDLLRKLLE
jgi:hypothetical protein